MKHTPLFTKGQRVAIMMLLTVVGCVVLTLLLVQHLKPEHSPDYAQEVAALEQEIQAFKNSLQVQSESTRVASHPKRGEAGEEETHSTLFAFNPNEADSVTLVQLGFSPYVARNIMRYRAKGGEFRKPEDLGKIYGMDSVKLREVMPYVCIPQDTIVQREKPRYAYSKKDTIIELNTADTVTLQYLKGIGPAYAHRILHYRKRLGGFHHIEQLREVIEWDDEDYAYISAHLTIDTSLIQPICVNTAGVEQLKKHPYIGFYAAKSIYETRRGAFELSDIAQLRGKQYLEDALLAKIQPYLSFEKRNKKLYQH